MKSYRLPRTPKPEATESLQGYVLRLYEKNGYTRPYALFSRAGMGIGTGRAINISKLQAIVGWGDELKMITYSQTSENLRKSQILGNPIRQMDLRPERVGLCVECLREKGFVQAHFDLVVMTACPVHKGMLLTHCGTCRKKLSPYRQGLLTCRCGAELVHCNPQSVLEREASLLDIVRRKALSLSIVSEYGFGFPPELTFLDLSTLLAVIDVLGKHLRVKVSLKTSDDRAMRSSVASEALSEWPNGFFQMIDRFGEGFSERNPATFGKGRMRNLYLALLRVDVPFVLAAFSDYVNRNYGEGCRSRLAGLTDDKGGPTYLSRRQVERRYGISPRTIDRTIKLNAVRAVNVSHGKKRRVFIEASDIASEQAELCELCNSEQAAQIIGLPSRVLLCLRKLGLSHPVSQRASARRFDLPAVREFARRFDPFLEIRQKACSETVRLDRLLAAPGVSLEVKAMVIDLMLSRKMYEGGSEDGSVAGILISEKLVLEARAREQSIALHSGGRKGIARLKGEGALPVTAHEAATEVECSRGALHVLVSRGILRGKKRKSTLWIERASLARFAARYVSVLSLARGVSTSTRALMEYCRRKKINMLVVRCGSEKRRQAFVCRGEASKILKGASKVLGVYSAKKAPSRVA